MRHEIKNIYHIVKLKSNYYNRGRISRRAKIYLNAIINKQIKQKEYDSGSNNIKYQSNSRYNR